MISSSRMDGVAALLIARFNSRRVRLISRWLRMAFASRDMSTILSLNGFPCLEGHKSNAGRRWDIPELVAGPRVAASMTRRDACAG
jgi:hypothetical protein